MARFKTTGHFGGFKYYSYNLERHNVMYIFKRVYNKEDLSQLITLAQECFVNDTFYSSLSADVDERVKLIGELFEKSFCIAIDYGMIFAHFDGGEVISFSLWIDYKNLMSSNTEAFKSIFPIDCEGYEFNIIENMIGDLSSCLYLIAIGVKPEYRKRGLASEHIDYIINEFPHYNLFSDVSNSSSLPIYLDRGFIVYQSKDDIIYVAKYN